jgi:hypothetical protein
MDWSSQLTRIRRWVRDPDGDIFTENFLLRLFNDELNQLYSLLGPVVNIQVVRVPPEFQGSYTHDWEWAYTEHDDGEVYQFGYVYDPGEYVHTFVWEAESIKGYSAATLEAGDVYTQPWEAWAVTTPHQPPPIPMPTDFEEMRLLCFDRDTVDPATKQDTMYHDDTAWRTRTGTPIQYWRDEKISNRIYLYPLPAETWQDDELGSADPDTAEYADISETVTFGNETLYFGTTLLTFETDDDAVDTDHNVLAIYRTSPAEITDSTDEVGLPEYIQKYVEYGTASRALRANTDGRIESLADYWEMRKKAGYEVIKKWLRLKLTDRDFQLQTRNSSGIGQRPKYPRLPSTYPDGWA